MQGQKIYYSLDLSYDESSDVYFYKVFYVTVVVRCSTCGLYN